MSIILENCCAKFQFLGEGILVTESFGSVCQGSQDSLSAGWWCESRYR